ncbi:MAG: HAD hydrolase-like protein [Planctomycetes bacterium]|nr:HAD hydrolase-like protein [Planctomycetota bacterium]
MARPAFLFDLDGTLADTLADLAASTNHVRALHGLPAAPLAAVRTFVGDGARTLLRRALHEILPEAAAAAAELLDRAFAEYIAHHERQCTGHATLYPGVRDHLRHLHGLGHPLAVVTNKPERFARPLLVHLGLAPLLGAIVGGDTLPQKKPDPAPVQFALHCLSAEARTATMVGDGVQDLRAGKAAGVRTIACLFGYGDPAALRAEGADAFWTTFGSG